MKTITIPPDAHNFLQGARNTGYTLNTALADIIDNSLSSGATVIDIHANIDCIAIIDNGSGMDESTLLEAMRVGSKDPLAKRDSDDLGRFGLGLNMASISMCDKTTVVTKTCTSEETLTLDLEHIKSNKNGWEYLKLDKASIPFADQLPQQGTLVLWEKLVGLQLPPIDEKTLYEKQYNEMINDAKEHIGLVYHRFINGSDGVNKCAIRLNHDPIKPFDPFISEQSIRHPPEPERFGPDKDITFQAFTLPHPSKVNKEDWEKFGMKTGYMNNQGLYVYRANRLIIWGNWFRLSPRKELTKLCRIKVDLPNTLESDQRWKITVDKSEAKLPPAFREKLSDLLDNLTGLSKSLLQKGAGAKLRSEASMPLWVTQQTPSGTKKFSVNLEHPMIANFLDNNDPIQLVKFIENNMPMQDIYAYLADSPPTTDTEKEDDQSDLQQTLDTMFSYWEPSNKDIESLSIELRAVPSLARNWDQVERLLKEKYQR